MQWLSSTQYIIKYFVAAVCCSLQVTKRLIIWMLGGSSSYPTHVESVESCWSQSIGVGNYKIHWHVRSVISVLHAMYYPVSFIVCLLMSHFLLLTWNLWCLCILYCTQENFEFWWIWQISKIRQTCWWRIPVLQYGNWIKIHCWCN